MENVLIRAYDSSYGSNDQDIVRKIAQQTWPKNPKLYSDEGMVMTYMNQNDQPKIIGFILYSYVKPETLNKNVALTSREAALWFDFDFGKHLNSFVESLGINDNNYKYNHQCDDKMKGNDEYLRCIQLNSNLKDLKNWNRISSHIIHITDFAMVKDFRGRGFGAYLLKSLIFSFPSSTRFGLEVASNNHIAINCYQKCGFIIERTIKDYYGKDRSGLKMVMISSYNDDDVTKFILSNSKTINDKENTDSKCDKNVYYKVRLATKDDTEGIKNIWYTVWPNHQEWDFTPTELTFVVEEINENSNNKEIVGFTQCDWKLLEKCAICKAIQEGKPVKRPKHTHFGWYLNVDFDENCVMNRIIPKRNDYQEFLSIYNKYLDSMYDRWNNLRKHMIHFKQFAISINHRHKGLGSLLMKHIIYSFPSSTMFGLEVEGTNYNAMRLYKKRGFTQSRKVKDYYGSDRDGFKMVLITKCDINESIKWLNQNKRYTLNNTVNDKNNNEKFGNGIEEKEILAIIQNENNNKDELKYEDDNEWSHSDYQLSKSLDGDRLENMLNNIHWDDSEDDNHRLYQIANDNDVDKDNKGSKNIVEYSSKINIREFDTYLDGIQVEILLNDKKSWNYWPYIDSKHGFVIELNDVIIGFIGYQYSEPLNCDEFIDEQVGSTQIGWTQKDFDDIECNQIIYITTLCINAKYHNQGFGTRLMTYFINSFNKKENISFGLEVETTNQFAIKLFTKLGFKIIRTLRNFYDFGRNAYKMSMSLINDDKDNCKLIKKALSNLCGNDWNKYFLKFKNEQVMDDDIYNLNNDDLKVLINKIGPRSRFRAFIKQLKEQNATVKI